MIYYVSLYENNCIATKCTLEKEKPNVRIPDTNSKGEQIVIIGAGCFAEKAIRTLYMNDDITDIGRYACYGCRILVAVRPSPKLKRIHPYGFGNCYKLSYFPFENNLEEVGDYAFRSNISMKRADLSKCSKLKRTGKGSFSDCESMKTALLPDGLEEISEYTFYKDVNFVDSPLPNTVSVIKAHAYDMTALTNITFPDSVQKIEEYAYANNPFLSTVEFGSEVQFLGNYCFTNDTSLKKTIFNNKIRVIPKGCFKNCDITGTVEIPASTQRIERLAFANNKNMTIVTITNNVEFIDDTAFEGCDQIKIKAQKGSYAHEYAKRLGITFINSKK